MCPRWRSLSVPSTALITGGGRGIGRNIALELAAAGASVAVAARSSQELRKTADEIGGLAIECDVADRESVERMVAQVESEYGRIDLLVANAGISLDEEAAWEAEPAAGWRVFEVNVLGVYLCCRAVIAGTLARGGGRIVNVASGAAYYRLDEHRRQREQGGRASLLGDARQPARAARHSGLLDQPRPRPHADDRQLRQRGTLDAARARAPARARALASGRLDGLAGRYLHAEHDDVDDLAARAEEIVASDLNAIRLRR